MTEQEKAHRLSVVLQFILDKLTEAEQKHPGWPQDEVRQAAIVVEEAGELLRETLSLQEYIESIPSMLSTTQVAQRLVTKVECRKRIQHEAAQTGAMAIRFLFNFPLDPLIQVEKDDAEDQGI